MKYENILSKKFLSFLNNVQKDKKVLDKEEKFFNKFKKAVESIKKE